MRNIFAAFLISSILSIYASENIRTAKFSKESVAGQPIGISYKRVGSSFFGRSGRFSHLQCVFKCTTEDNCKSVYIDGQACVFGVDDVTVFEEGEVVAPDPSQVLRVKGKTRLR